MTEQDTNLAPAEQAPVVGAAAEAGPTAAEQAQQPAKPSSKRPAPRARTNAKSSAPEGATLKCAACGKTGVFEGETTIGGHEPIIHHGCAASAQLLHDYWIALLNDPGTKLPTLVAK